RSDQVYLQRIGDPGVIFVGSFSDPRTLQSGKFLTRSADVTIPDDARGLYRLLVSSSAGSQSAFALSRGIVHIDAKPQADLEVTSLTVPPIAHAGESIAADFTVANLGGDVRKSTWTDNLYLSLAPDTVNGAINVASLANPSALEPGESYQSHIAPF